MAGKVTKEMGLIDIVQNHPEALEVFAKYGLGCIGCAAARFENLEAGAKVHGVDPDVMVDEINALIEANEYILYIRTIKKTAKYKSAVFFY